MSPGSITLHTLLGRTVQVVQKSACTPPDPITIRRGLDSN
ncbi:hypothetical protein SXCC_01257 [Gluconacetobacter sp. SXCC-1]|nr:hypothetical protein SXCC_01257 [Gluconacetobacter sp. SXCC-1]